MLVFESSITSFVGVVFTVISLFFLFKSYQYLFSKKEFKRKTVVFGSLFLGITFLIHPFKNVLDFYQVQKAIDSNLVKHVAGKTEKFMHDDPTDSFIVNGIKFEYTRGGSSVYYEKVVGTGSFIRKNAQKVKIDYIEVDGENKIIKLWVYE